MTDGAFVAIIPAHRPTEALAFYAGELKARGIAALVVDDCSGAGFDGVFSACEKDARVMRSEARRGRGNALKAGIAAAREWPGVRAIATLEAHGRYGAGDVARALRMAQENPGKLILGARRMGFEGPRHKRFEGAVTRAACRWATGARVRDPQCILRAFGPELTELMLGVPGERYEYEINALLRCTKKRVPILEVDVETNYLNAGRRVRLSAMRDFLRAYLNIVKFALSSLAGFATDYALYNVLIEFTSVQVSNVSARVVSASVNYFINNRLIFKSNDSMYKTATQYFLLAAAILAANTRVLTFLTDSAGMNERLAKLVTEVAFFSLSWIVQRYLIFRKKEKA